MADDLLADTQAGGGKDSKLNDNKAPPHSDISRVPLRKAHVARQLDSICFVRTSRSLLTCSTAAFAASY